MENLKFYFGQAVPLEMHKVRIVQKLNLLPIEERFKALTEAGNNTFLLRNRDVFLDMLTDSGTNAMSDRQLSAMMIADDAYAGSETYYRLEERVKSFFGMSFFLPAHQGRACENIICRTFVKPGNIVPMNYHFTTTKSHITINGGHVLELFNDEAIKETSDEPFKGNMDLVKLEKVLNENKGNIAFVRLELGTNLIGGQPISLKNIQDVSKICKEHQLMLVVDASLLADNLYFIKKRECPDMSLNDIVQAIGVCTDIMYFSARKLGHAKGGGICMHDASLCNLMKELVPLFEGFLTYGGMSTREMEALTIGLDETLDLDMISQGPSFIKYMGQELIKRGVPIITPTGGLGCHINARAFVDHLKGEEYPAGSLAAAIYLVSGARGMERGTMSEDRKSDGQETISSMELVRMALPRRVFTASQIAYLVDRIAWLYQNRHLIGGLKFTEEPKILRFFFGRLTTIGNWQEKLVKQFRADFGDSL